MSIPEKLKIKTSLKILKPAHEVFEAIVDPAKMSNYFIAKSTGRMEAGKTQTWLFPEFDMEFPVRVEKVVKEEYISYSWDDWEDNRIKTLVEISLEEKGKDETLVTVREGSRENNEAGIKWLSSNTEGWANVLACLNGYLEDGINLREGAFDFMRK
jgi:uncharacterized protein YndB with AHSA1/START domain